MTPRDIAYSCILKTRAIDEQELIDKYKRACEKHNAMALWGQLQTAIRNLRQQGLVKIVDDKIIRS